MTNRVAFIVSYDNDSEVGDLIVRCEADDAPDEWSSDTGRLTWPVSVVGFDGAPQGWTLEDVQTFVGDFSADHATRGYSAKVTWAYMDALDIAN